MKQLYVDTIRSVCSNDYSKEELEVWSSSSQKTERWQEMMATQFVLLAEINNQIVGFASLKESNYIDFFYIHKDFQGKGIAKQLLLKIEQQAKENGSHLLSSDISITAKPFFEKHDFIALKEQYNVRENVVLVNYKMEKKI
ncbi:GNAT family N-acetyltransferase [Flavobacterium silvaticum]|uniref:GNAT family N-acetyltransferase n=1 Tax=Flavobacterium silvaticum TaxID=1852020 RepID=A0A972JGG4_9FLAO|nr:GNAT family N-acetyltransferase [Flavobacterium silvaticum]NMH26835.1 GNAT family N-acetyltransferase [Flavobacterium silvaticum]